VLAGLVNKLEELHSKLFNLELSDNVAGGDVVAFTASLPANALGSGETEVKDFTVRSLV
jgi:hypothetical protein